MVLLYFQLQALMPKENITNLSLHNLYIEQDYSYSVTVTNKLLDSKI